MFALAEKHWRKILYAVGGLVLLGLVLFVFDRCGSYWTDRGISKQKQKIVNTASEIANVRGQINELEKRDAELRGELKRDVETLANATFGLEDAKVETNKALANLEKAANSKLGNVNATTEDLLKALDKLENRQ